MFELSALTVTVLLSLVIPIVTGLLTKITVSAKIKGSITLVLNAVNALIVSSVVADGTAVLSGEVLVTFILGVVISLASYHGVYKPLGVTSSKEDGKLKPHSGVIK